MAAASGADPAGRPPADAPGAELGKLLRGNVDKLMPNATPDRSA